MAEKDGLRVGAKVWVKDKDLYGTVRSVDERASEQLYPNTYILFTGLWAPPNLPPGSGSAWSCSTPVGRTAALSTERSTLGVRNTMDSSFELLRFR